jgi:hypothetical protein
MCVAVFALVMLVICVTLYALYCGAGKPNSRLQRVVCDDCHVHIDLSLCHYARRGEHHQGCQQ